MKAMENSGECPAYFVDWRGRRFPCALTQPHEQHHGRRRSDGFGPVTWIDLATGHRVRAG